MEDIGKLPTSQSSFHDHPHTQESHPLAVLPQQQLQMEVNEMNDDALDHHELVGVGEGYQGGLDDQVTWPPYLSYPITLLRSLCNIFCNLLSTDILSAQHPPPSPPSPHSANKIICTLLYSNTQSNIPPLWTFSFISLSRLIRKIINPSAVPCRSPVVEARWRTL